MKNVIIFLLLIILVSCATVKYQIEDFEDDFQRDQVIISIDSLYLYIDNSPYHWYTFEIFADEVVQIENSQYFIMDHKFVQMGSMPFNIGKKYIVKGSLEAEKYALFKYMRWERDFQEKTLKCDLEEGNEYYTNKKGKQFLIWWWKSPKDSQVPLREITFSNESVVDSFIDSVSISLEVDYQLNLCYIIQGEISATLCVTVLEDENLDNAIMKLKRIADTFNFYGFFIDFEKLAERLTNKNSYTFEDSLKTFSIQIPDYVNMITIGIDGNFQSFTLPEKNNVINAVGLTWNYKTEFETFDEYIKDNDMIFSVERDSIFILEDSLTKRRIFFTKDDGYFHCQEILIEKDEVYLQFTLTATENTYNFNLERFNEFVENVK